MTIRILIIIFLLIFSAQISLADLVSVKGDNVHLRSAPDTDADIKWEYGKGFPLKIVEKKGKWVKVADFEQDTGWVHSSLLTGSPPHVIVNANKSSNTNVNIRKAPSVKEQVVGKAYYGVVFELREVKDDWIKVRHETGLEGWIKRNLLWGL